MKTLPSLKSAAEVLAEVKDTEDQLDLASVSISTMEEDLEQIENGDPTRMDALKLLMSTKLQFSKDVCRVVMLKARYGIVGNSWYNDTKQR